MKRKTLLLAISFMSFIFANAQFAENNALYAASELNFGNYFGVNLDLNYVLKEKYSFKVEYSGNLRKAKSIPEDFSIGLTGIFLFGLTTPVDRFQNYGATVGRIYKINQSGTIRANLSLGIGYTVYTEPENWEKISSDYDKNYTYDKVKHEAVSLIVNPKIEFPITRFFGFTLSPMLQINKDRTYIGVGFGTMIGLLR